MSKLRLGIIVLFIVIVINLMIDDSWQKDPNFDRDYKIATECPLDLNGMTIEALQTDFAMEASFVPFNDETFYAFFETSFGDCTAIVQGDIVQTTVWQYVPNR